MNTPILYITEHNCYNKINPNYFITICCIFKYYLKEGHKYG